MNAHVLYVLKLETSKKMFVCLYVYLSMPPVRGHNNF